MKTDIRISIPVPCHEDWNRMTPNEQGSFCGKCCKTVLDFSGKSPEEIRDTLLEQNGKKVCGRFTNEQLVAPQEPVKISILPFELSPRISGTRAFAIALFIVFGTSLFSCVTPQGHTVGEIAVDTSRNVNSGIHSPVPVDSSAAGVMHTLGETVVEPECHVKGDVDVQFVQGEIEAVPDTVVTPAADTLPEKMKMGKIKMYTGKDE